jgi:hypothetical protein
MLESADGHISRASRSPCEGSCIASGGLITIGTLGPVSRRYRRSRHRCLRRTRFAAEAAGDVPSGLRLCPAHDDRCERHAPRHQSVPGSDCATLEHGACRASGETRNRRPAVLRGDDATGQGQGLRAGESGVQCGILSECHETGESRGRARHPERAGPSAVGPPDDHRRPLRGDSRRDGRPTSNIAAAALFASAGPTPFYGGYVARGAGDRQQFQSVFDRIRKLQSAEDDSMYQGLPARRWKTFWLDSTPIDDVRDSTVPLFVAQGRAITPSRPPTESLVCRTSSTISSAGRWMTRERRASRRCNSRRRPWLRLRVRLYSLRHLSY